MLNYDEEILVDAIYEGDVKTVQNILNEFPDKINNFLDLVNIR